ncbi:MAG: hypothetical protein ACRDLS_00980 [Solirubrobacteraceae bacterium]
MPLLGILFVAVAVIGFAVGGEPPGADEGAAKVVDHYVDNKDAIQAGAAIQAAAAALFLYFVAYLSSVLRASAERSVLPTLALIGAAIMATGIAIDATISFALSEAADDLAPAGAQALQALWDNDFFPMAVGLQVFILSTGLAVLKYGALPKWLGWIAIVLAVIAVTPIGFAAFIGGGVWLLITSVLLTMQARAA